MLHKFFESGDWFAAKKFGYGSGLPIAWQGWVTLAAFLTLSIGSALIFERAGTAGRIVAGGVFVGATIVFVLIAKKRTRGGWRWRP